MTLPYLLAPVLSLLLLAAHFYRSTNHLLATLCVCLTFLTLVRRPIAARLLQIMLFIGAIEWLRSAIFLVKERAAMGESFARLALILGAVCLFTALSAIIFQTKALKTRFSFPTDNIDNSP